MDRVGGPDLGSAVLLAQQSHRHRSAHRPTADTAECSARTAPAHLARSWRSCGTADRFRAAPRCMRAGHRGPDEVAGRGR